MLWKRGFLFDADTGGAGGGAGDGGNEQGGDNGGTPLVFDAWIASQPDDVKTLLDTHTRGLKSALDSERDARKKVEKELRDLAANAEKDSDAQRQLTAMADQMSEADRKADFYEAAHAVGVSNLRLAYTVAVQDEMFDRRGQVNFDQMKQSYPELFVGEKPNKKPAGNAGAGTNGDQPAATGMNTFIRRAAGRE